MRSPTEKIRLAAIPAAAIRLAGTRTTIARGASIPVPGAAVVSFLDITQRLRFDAPSTSRSLRYLVFSTVSAAPPPRRSRRRRQKRRGGLHVRTCLRCRCFGPGARRQCGRCRGGDGLCAGRHSSKRRKHRRRWIHDRPYSRRARHGVRLSRARAMRSTREMYLGAMATSSEN